MEIRTQEIVEVMKLLWRPLQAADGRSSRHDSEVVLGASQIYLSTEHISRLMEGIDLGIYGFIIEGRQHIDATQWQQVGQPCEGNARG